VALDGVFVAGNDGELQFHELVELDSMDVADLLQVVRFGCSACSRVAGSSKAMTSSPSTR
jgi:hypothetical protein